MAKRSFKDKDDQEKGFDAVALHELLANAVPPQNLDAERATLGGVLRASDCMAELVKRLTPENFYGAAHKKIFAAMCGLYQDGEPLDALTVAEELRKRKQLVEAGGAPLLQEIAEETLTAANVHRHAEIVWEKAVLRGLVGAGTELVRDAFEGIRHADDLLAEAEKRIFSLTTERSGGDTHDLGKVLNAVFSRIDKRQKGEATHGVPTGFRDLDELTNGWQKSELIILAARPSVGKTAFALNLADCAAVGHGIPTLVCSLEMSEIELAERMLCSRARVNAHLLRRGRATPDDMAKLIHASGQMSSALLYIDDTPGQTMLRIAATARRLKMKRGLGLVIIDYLQLIEPEDKRVGRVEQIGAISRRLKTLARELDVPVIALSQLNRSVESREGHHPRMSDLRESGSIEQDADVVAMLHREDAFNPDTEKKGEAELILCKQRNGPVGDVKLTFIKELTRFQDYAAEIGAFSDTGGDDHGF